MKSLILIFTFISTTLVAQETNYYINDSSAPKQELDLNEYDLNDITYSVEIPAIAYEFDLITLNLYKIVEGEVRRFDFYEYGLRYTPLQLKSLKTGVLTGRILDGSKEYSEGDFSRIHLSDFIDKEKNSASFFIGLNGFEISGYEERYNSSRNVYEKYPVYTSGTLLNTKKMVNIYQRDGWEKRKAERLAKLEKERDAYAKKERRNSIIKWSFAGAIAIVVLILYYG